MATISNMGVPYLSSFRLRKNAKHFVEEQTAESLSLLTRSFSEKQRREGGIV